jgi:hypothetical protein
MENDKKDQVHSSPFSPEDNKIIRDSLERGRKNSVLYEERYKYLELGHPELYLKFMKFIKEALQNIADEEPDK